MSGTGAEESGSRIALPEGCTTRLGRTGGGTSTGEDALDVRDGDDGAEDRPGGFFLRGDSIIEVGPFGTSRGSLKKQKLDKYIGSRISSAAY